MCSLWARSLYARDAFITFLGVKKYMHLNLHILHTSNPKQNNKNKKEQRNKLSRKTFNPSLFQCRHLKNRKFEREG